ncbi:hypothetical protein [Chitinimonas lacunae]|uniref:Uncharacterized protein n=1 Tax=Chitinimonas lacunae TaxID=1963018 RepID=A0ABV8MLL9_9NEIS
MTKTLLVSLLALSATAFAADTPAPAADAAPAAASPAKHSCTKVDHPGRLASETQVKTYTKRFKEYGECIKKFVDEQNKVSTGAMEAANTAINEYNEAVKQSKEASAK